MLCLPLHLFLNHRLDQDQYVSGDRPSRRLNLLVQLCSKIDVHPFQYNFNLTIIRAAELVSLGQFARRPALQTPQEPAPSLPLVRKLFVLQYLFSFSC